MNRLQLLIPILLLCSVFLFAGCNENPPVDLNTEPVQSSEAASGDAAATDETEAEPSDTEDVEEKNNETKIDIKNTLTKDEAEAIVELLTDTPITYEELVSLYGKANHFSRQGSIRYRVEGDGMLYLIENGEKLCTVEKLDFTESPKTDIYLAQFESFIPGVTTEEEVREVVGIAHELMGSGAIRDVYNTADGHRVSVYFYNGRVAEIREYFDDGTDRIINQSPTE